MRSSVRMALMTFVPVLCIQIADAQEPPAESESSGPPPTAIPSPEIPERFFDKKPAQPRVENAATLRFAFEGAPWREVIKWLAEEGELALHVSDLPTGSFTYSDPSVFTHEQAVDRVNLFLLPQGYTLVRRGKLLSVINLGDPRSMQQLDAIADFVSVKELANRKNYEVVKCIFPLGDIDAEDAVNELSVLNLMTNPAVFSKTNQLMITDTAGKLKNVKAVLDAFDTEEMENGTIVQNFTLRHVDAEDILLVARPHLGLATGETIGIDVSVSADPNGKNIFVTGIADKVKLLENLIQSLDVPQKTMANNGENVLKSHSVSGGNVETVYNVLLTLLANKEVRLSMDKEADAIVALATPETQKEIEATVAQLQASEADFEVIPLKTADPYFVISLIEEMLDLPDSLTDPKDIDPDAPKIDADPGNMRLFVRAKRSQIDQIKKIVAGLDSTSTSVPGESSQLRVVPIKGKEAIKVLETAATFWRGANPIILFQSLDSLEQSTERVLDEKSQAKVADENITLTGRDMRSQRVLTKNANNRAPIIRCQITLRGLLLQSEDTIALDRFEEHLRAIAGPLDSLPSPPIVFYLKYTKSNDAIQMLAELIDGGDAAREGEAGTLVNGFVSSSSVDSFLGSFVTSRDGTTTLTAGSLTVVSDTRLNRLIAQGSAADIERLEEYLKIVDKDKSLTAIETGGTSHVIELVNTNASEVADVIRQAFGNQVEGGKTGLTGASKGSPEQQRAAALAAAKAAAQEKARQAAEAKKGKSGGSTQSKDKDLTPKMTIAVHEPSNSLIITAPDQLFERVQELVKTIDERGKQNVEVITPLNGEIYEAVLQQMMGLEPTQRDQRNSSSPTSRSSSKSR